MEGSRNSFKQRDTHLLGTMSYNLKQNRIEKALFGEGEGEGERGRERVREKLQKSLLWAKTSHTESEETEVTSDGYWREFSPVWA